MDYGQVDYGYGQVNNGYGQVKMDYVNLRRDRVAQVKIAFFLHSAYVYAFGKR